LRTLDCDKHAIRRGLSRRTSRPRRRTGRRCSISDEAASSAALTASFCSPQPTHPRLPPTPGTPQGQTRKLVRNRGIRVKRGERFRLARRADEVSPAHGLTFTDFRRSFLLTASP